MLLFFPVSSSRLRSAAKLVSDETMAMCAEDFVRDARYPLPKTKPPMRSGIRMVATRNALVRMRSRYSRLAMSQMLCIDVNSCRLRGLRRFGYLFDEDLFQRRLHHFEASDAGFDDCRGEERLRVGAFVETDLGVPTV